LAGVLLGLLIIPKRFRETVGKIVDLGVVCVIFFMGVSLGGSPSLWEDLADGGIKALVISAFGVAFSVLSVWLLNKAAAGRGEK